MGKAIAAAYAKEGAKISLADFNEEALNHRVARFGRVDILVNCAGVLDYMQAVHNVEDAI